MIFYPMNEFPTRVKGGNYSVPVLVFSADNPTFCEMGYYNFETQKWLHFGESSVVLISWCYMPNHEAFLEQVKNMAGIP